MFILLFVAAGINWHCPHKPIDPGLEDEGDVSLFSLPAPPTDGQVEFKVTQYRTRGSNQLQNYQLQYSQETLVTYAYAGSQIQFEKKIKSDGTVTYAPKWVISASRSAQDVSDRKNTIVISILPDYDIDPLDATPSTWASRKLWCDKPDNITASDFCEGILDTGGSFAAGTTGDYKSFEAYLYAGCTEVSGNCSSAQKPGDYGTYAYDLDNQSGGSGNQFKEFFYSEYAGTNPNQHGKKFQVVIEFLDGSGNLYTTKFPFNGQTDNLGNHTPVILNMAAFADPRLDPSTFTIGQANTYMATNDGDNTKNCTGVQGNSNGATAANTIDCTEVILATAATINTDDIGAGEAADDDIIHKMQLAGKEFRAAGTDLDPRFEMTITEIDFSVQRGVNRFLTD